MSPARARTSPTEIVAAGRALLEAGGVDAVTMQAVAARVGVRGPSLYKRFPNRGALVAAIGTAALDELHDELEPFVAERDPADGLAAAARAYRAFAHRNPRTYELLFMSLPADARPPAERNARAAAPVLALVERITGPDHALDAARLVTAFAHGFVSMELSGAFRLGGDVDEAFRSGVDVIVTAIAAEPARPTRRRQRR